MDAEWEEREIGGEVARGEVGGGGGREEAGMVEEERGRREGTRVGRDSGKVWMGKR